MKKILDCFEYLKRYQVDLFESICILLECFVLKQNHQIPPLLQKAQKRQKIYKDYCQLVQKYTQVTPPNPHLNLAKVLKVVKEVPLQDIGLFFDLITQKKTNNKLFFYTTPLEVSILLNALADLKAGESLYNPCFGLGSLFLQIPKKVKIYGEELDERFVKIASLICLLSLKEANLICNDILKQPSFKNQNGFLQFDKVICNPPLHSHLGTNYIKEDERSSGLVSKSYPELVFVLHSLVHLKNRGIFILRKGVFKALESKDIFLGKLECIIDLPKNIFPYQNHDFCIVIVGEKREEILYIDARGDFFCQKDGRYNRLKNINEIVKIYQSHILGKYSKILLSVDEMFELDAQENDGYRLADLAWIFKGQRTYGSSRDEAIDFFEVGVSDFSLLGFSDRFEHRRFLGDRKKIEANALKPYDILISWRGNSPKISILSPTLSSLCVANMGILVVRAKNKDLALGIYAYLFGHLGYERLCEICTDSLDLNKLKNFSIPLNIEEFSAYMQEIQSIAQQLQEIQTKIIDLKEKI